MNTPSKESGFLTIENDENNDDSEEETTIIPPEPTIKSPFPIGEPNNASRRAKKDPINIDRKIEFPTLPKTN
jgi:hypothetical protein